MKFMWNIYIDLNKSYNFKKQKLTKIYILGMDFGASEKIIKQTVEKGTKKRKK